MTLEQTRKRAGFMLATVWLLAAVAVVSAFASCRSAEAADGTPGLRVEYFQADSARVIARWAKSCDTKGCADSYRVAWTAGTVSRNVTTSALADTFRVTRPAFGDSLLASVGVSAVRRGSSSVARTASVYVRNPDAAPPAVDSLRVDTTRAALVDSSRMDFYAVSGASLGNSHTVTPLTIAEKDSVLIVYRMFLKSGAVRSATDTTSWQVVSDSSSARLSIRPLGSGLSADSAWLVALDCGCRESGNPSNPPRLDLRSGEYVVRGGAGLWVPVTPLSDRVRARD
jgi:hypothetical protein